MIQIQFLVAHISASTAHSNGVNQIIPSTKLNDCVPVTHIQAAVWSSITTAKWVMRMQCVCIATWHDGKKSYPENYRAFIHCVHTTCLYPYCSGVEFHFEFLQVEPVFWLARVQVMVEVPCCIAKTVELPVWSQQDRGWSLLIGHTRIPTFPTPERRKSVSLSIHVS